MKDRRSLIRQALTLEYLTIGWNIAESFIAIVAGWMAGSVALIGFGLDSVVEVLAAAVLVWRLRYELLRKGKHYEKLELRAQRFVGGTLFLLAIYILLEASTSLWHKEIPQVSEIGLALGFISAVLMPFLALRKRQLAKALNSKALAADAAESAVCAYLSITLIVGLGLHAILGWWWADPVAALLMLPILIREGKEAFTEA